MIYPLSLQTVGLTVGALLLVAHLAALLLPALVQGVCKKFPRSREAGVVLLTLAALWWFLLLSHIDLGEWSPLRQPFLIVTVVGYLLTLFFVKEFLAVRALGMLLLLAAEVLLEVAWMRDTHYLMPILAYVWIVLGIFWVGKPYLLRDHLAWLSRASWRWSVAALAGAAYGAVLMVFALGW